MAAFADTATQEARLLLIHSTVERYRSYGWEWNVIAPIINRLHGTSYTTASLRTQFEK